MSSRNDAGSKPNAVIAARPSVALPVLGERPVAEPVAGGVAGGGDQRDELLLEPVEDGPHLGRRRPRLEVVEEDVVRVGGRLEARDVLAASARAAGRATAGRRRSRWSARAATHASIPSDAAFVSSAARSAGTRRAFSQSRRVTRIRLASSESYGSDASSVAELLHELADPVVDEPLVCDPLERRQALGADGGAGRRHHHHLVPVEQRRAPSGDRIPLPAGASARRVVSFIASPLGGDVQRLGSASGGRASARMCSRGRIAHGLDPRRRSPSGRRREPDGAGRLEAAAPPDPRLDCELARRPADDVEAVRLAEAVRAGPVESRCGREHERAADVVVQRLEGVSLDRGALVDVAAEDELRARAASARSARRGA